MGCSTSSPDDKNNTASERYSVGKFLTHEEKIMIKDTWDIVSKDLPATGLAIFSRLFEMEKDFKKLFRRLMTQGESGEMAFDSVRLERHANLVMTTLGEVVAALDDSSYLEEILRMLGNKHLDYNVKPEMFQFLWPAIRDSLKMRVGEKFTMDHELAWKHLFDFIFFHMVYGATHKKGAKIEK